MSLNEETKQKAIQFQGFFKASGGENALEQIDRMTGYHEKQSLFNADPYLHAFNAGMYSVSVQIHKMLDMKIERKEE